MQKLKDALGSFSESRFRLARLLKEGAAVTPEELLNIENSILIIQLALALKTSSARRLPSATNECEPSPQCGRSSDRPRRTEEAPSEYFPSHADPRVLRVLQTCCPEIPLIVFRLFPENQYRLRALRAGAVGYVSKKDLR